MDDSIAQLVNSKSNSLELGVYTLNNDEPFSALNKYNYFVVILILTGKGTVVTDASEYGFTENSLMCFSLYQPFKIKSDGEFKCVMVNFHPGFFCLHKHRNEVSCNGVLFNNNYESPVTSLKADETQLLLTTITHLKAELQQAAVAQLEALISYLKILLINTSRIKMEQRGLAGTSVPKPPVILNELKDAIEQHFKSMHGAGDYARLLNISTAALNKISKIHFNKTLSALITDRIIIEAKRQLYLTARPVKIIAYELGFTDEFYFSRFFKSHVAISPQFFRDTVGFDRGNA